jgi:hypothetical protein
MLGATACSSGPDHKEAACSHIEKVFTALSSSSETAADDLIAANAILIAGLSVWSEEGGKSEETYTLLTGYSGKLLMFTATNSPQSARDFIDYEDENKSRIQEICGLSTE